MRRNSHQTILAAVAVALAGAAIPAAVLPSRRVAVTPAVDSRGFRHGLRRISEADAQRIAAAQAKRERKATKRAASQQQGEPKQ